MKKLALILTLILVPAFALAQTSGKLSGTVTGDGQPLVGANVLVKGTSYGAATDQDGQYYILDVPVGSYEIEVQYIGYKTLTISNVRANANLTTVLNFELEVAAVEGEMVQVTAERPLIVINATNTTAIIENEVLQALPVRNVADIIALQAGAVGGNIRGGRSGDNAYYIDGVLMKNRWTGGNLLESLSQRSMSEISFQAGGTSAEFGNANGGIVSIATASGGKKIGGSFEMVRDLGDTSPGTDRDKLYSYGNQIYNFSVGGPLTNNINWFVSVEQEKNTDSSPSSSTAPFAKIIEYSSPGGLDSSFVFDADGDLNSNILYLGEFIRDNQINTDSLIAGVASYDTTYIAAYDYEQLYGAKRMDENEITRYFAKVDLDLRPLRLKIGIGGYDNKEDNQYSHTSHLLNWKNGISYQSTNQYFYANATYSISPRSYIKAIASLNKYEQIQGNRNTGRDFEQVGTRTTDIGSDFYYYRDHGQNALAVADVVNFRGYGWQWDDYYERTQDATGLNLSYLNQMGDHELKLGMEYYSTKIKWYDIDQTREVMQNIAKLDTDFNGAVSLAELGDFNGDGSENQTDLDDWKFNIYRNAYVNNLGYDIFGNEASSYEESTHSIGPANPIESRFFIQDKLELADVIVQFGLSYETFDPQADAPDSDGKGGGDAAGFRNLHFHDGRIDRSGTQTGSYEWKPVEKHTALLPKLGFSFPVTDKTVFHAQYGTYWQTPPLQWLYLSDSELAGNITSGNMTQSANPTLKPERTTAYEVGIAQQIGEIAAVHVTGYYKEVRDYVLLKNHLPLDTDNDGVADDYPLVSGSEFSWAQFQNGDYGVTQGFSFNLNMRRFKGVLADLNYTYMNARGTGSVADDNFNIAWIGEVYPTTINRLSYDQKHTGSLMVDYRNPMGFGLNALYTFGSGQAYTPTTIQSDVFGRGWNIPVAAINSGSKPWIRRLDVRADYNLSLAGADVNVYLLVQNVFNTENIDDVRNATGQVADDGWLETAEGQVWLAGQEKNYPNAPARNLYLDRLSNPSRWDIPRIVRFGLQVSI